jgi:cytochrome b561
MAETTAYGGTARFFHWLTVGLLLIIMPIGLVMGDLPRGLLQDTLFVTHESLGLTVLALTLLRLFWRLSHGVPPPSADLSPMEVLASGGVHWLLYLVLIVMPLMGYLFVAFSGIELHYFGLISVPEPVPVDKETGKAFLAIHASLQWAIYGLVLMHAGAALHHYFMRRNDVLQRMLPGLRRLRPRGG